MPDPLDIDTAIVAKLGADATLLSYVPNGVYWDQAPPNSTRFVTVSLVDPHEVWKFEGVAYVHAVYKVVARVLLTASASNTAKAAAQRIHALLHEGVLTVSGYSFMAMYRDEENEPWIHFIEVDEVDPSIRWDQRGGHFVVEMAPTS